MALSIIHNGNDITDSIKFSQCYLHDIYGGGLDYLTIEFPEEKTDFEFFQYDEISILADGYKTGLMYIDDLLFGQERYIISAIPYKPSGKRQKSGIWKNIQYQKIAQDIATENGLTLKLYGVEDFTYESLTRNNEHDLQFLNRISEREGLSIKIYDGNLIIFNEKHIENDYEPIEIFPSDVEPDYQFKLATNGVRSVTTQYFNIETGETISYTAEDSSIDSGHVTITEHMKDVGEAQRFAYGYLRKFNKNELTGRIAVDLNTSISACTVLNLNNFSEFSGRYVVCEVVHDILNELTTMKIRKTLAY